MRLAGETDRLVRQNSRPAPVPAPPREGAIWWSAAPPAEADANDQSAPDTGIVTEEQLREWLSCTAGWKALELSWGALQGCQVGYRQLKPLLQAALAEAARLGAAKLVVRQLDVDAVLGRCCLALALAAFPNFNQLQLRELNLYDECMGHLCGALHACEHLLSLQLESVWASEGGWAALAAAVKVNASLQTLKLRDCLKTPAALRCVCGALGDLRGGALRQLVLARNELGDAGVAEVCKALTRSGSSAPSAGRCSPPAHVDLSHNGAGRGCVAAAVALVRGCRALRHLDLSHNDLGAEGTRELCRALASAPHLTSLHLAATGADDQAAEALVRALTASSGSGAAGGGLSTLCLAHNRVGHRGAALLAAAARRPAAPLTDLDLTGNGLVGEQGAKAWAETLAAAGGRCRLRRLVLSGCEIPDAGAFALGAALRSNTGLHELRLADNHLTTQGLALLAEVLKVNTSLRLLDVSYNRVGPRGLTPFSRHLAASSSGSHSTHHHHHQHSRSGECFPPSRTGSSSDGPMGQSGAAIRSSTCVVKAELLPEYRAVEAVKHSPETWMTSASGGPTTAGATGAAAASGMGTSGGAGVGASNPFGSPSAAAAGGGGGGGGAWGRCGGGIGSNGGMNGGMQYGASSAGGGGGSNPFMSPRAAYVNPFLANESPRSPEQPSYSHPRNPFLDSSSDGEPYPDGDGDCDVNPFRSPPPVAATALVRPYRSPHSNPFLMAAEGGGGGAAAGAAASSGGGIGRSFADGTTAAEVAGGGNGSGGVGASHGGGGPDGRTLVTRVLSRLGTGAPGSDVLSAGGDGSMVYDNALYDSSLNGSGSARYVSSRSTADEGDLVTEGDMKLVDLMLEDMGSGEAAEAPQTPRRARMQPTSAASLGGASASGAAFATHSGARASTGASVSVLVLSGGGAERERSVISESGGGAGRGDGAGGVAVPAALASSASAAGAKGIRSGVIRADMAGGGDGGGGDVDKRNPFGPPVVPVAVPSDYPFGSPLPTPTDNPFLASAPNPFR